ncbi:MAG TPA: hypothetical protein VFQ20_01635, partial [Burkholderiaceae bacterium]|nr:hypothetical protein [Burkholderiaceae bacterium]
MERRRAVAPRAAADALAGRQRPHGADHATFGGNGQQRITARRGPLRRADGALAAEPVHQARIAAVTTLWWRAHLLGDA